MTKKITSVYKNGEEYLIEGKQGPEGKQGSQGDSVIVGEGDLPLAHVLGGSNEKAMSQIGVTEQVVAEYETTRAAHTEATTMQINSSGKIISTSWYYVRYIQVNAGEIYKLNYKDTSASGNNRYLCLAIFDAVPAVGSMAAAILLYRTDVPRSTEFNVEHIYIPQSGYLCVFFQTVSSKPVQPTLYKGITVKDKTAALAQGVSSLDGKLESATIEKVSAGTPNVTNDKYVNDQGAITANGGTNPSAVYSWTGLDNTKTYYASFKRPNATSSASVAIAYYNGTTFLGYEYKETGGNPGNNVTDYKCTLPEGTNRIIVTSYHDVAAALKFDKQVEERVTELETKVGALEEVKILCFGNSFTQDSMGYVPFILEQFGIKATIGIAAIGGGTLSDHATKLASSTNTYSSTWWKFKAGSSAWPSAQTKTVAQIFADEDWDIVTFQQGSTRNYGTYNTWYKNALIAIVKELPALAQHPVILGFILTHSARSYNPITLLKRYEGSAEDSIAGIVPNTERVFEDEPFTLLLPYGTAIQNCRTVEALRDIYSEYGCANMLSDGTHLSDGVPCLAANYANAIAIMQAIGKGDKSIIGDSLRPDYAWCTAKNIPGKTTSTTDNSDTTTDFTDYTTTDADAYLAQIAATFANKKPFEVTDINKYTTT